MIKIPKQYREPLIPYFPVEMDFYIPGFENSYPIGKGKTLALTHKNCGDWYNEFIDKVLLSISNKEFLPVCRICDGEFLFFLGEQPLDVRLNLFKRIKANLSKIKNRIELKGGIGAYTKGHYHSGLYSKEEWLNARSVYPIWLKEISKVGILAIHLISEKVPFAEQYYPAFSRFLLKNNIEINNDNYYPFYFVYAMLVGHRKSEIFKNRRILIVNGFSNQKRDSVMNSIYNEGAKEIFWLPISTHRSLYDSIDITPFYDKVDLVLVGAGIGKPNILYQLKDLNVPCIDAGYIFEVWANPISKFKRPFCVLDFNSDFI